MTTKGDESATGARNTVIKRSVRDMQQKRASRDSAIALIRNLNVFPFKFNGSFMCFYCPSVFVNMPELARHVQVEHKHVTEDDIKKAILVTASYQPIKINVLNYSCKLCNDEISNFEGLKHHLIGKHDQRIDIGNEGVIPYKITENEFICVLCEKNLERYWILNKHINEHFTKYMCNECGTGFATFLRLRSHVASHEEGHYPCDLCDKVFNNVTSKQQHILHVHKKSTRYKCHHCGETFQEYARKQKHLLSAHGIRTRDKKGASVKRSPINIKEAKDETVIHEVKPNKASRNSAIVLIHSANICPFRFNRSFMCFYCSDRFIDMSELLRHVGDQHKHVTEDDIRKACAKDGFNHPIKVNILDYSCKLCSEEIFHFEDLKKHLIDRHQKEIDPANDGVLPYKITKDDFICVLCGKILEQYWNLNKHMNQHYSKFRCDQCGAGFATRSRLRGHAISHESQHFSCDKCSKVFSNIWSQQQHARRVHLKLPRYKCPQCGDTFKEKYQKQNHLFAVHGVQLNKCDAIINENINKLYLRNRKRDSAIALITSTNVCPFKYRGSFSCYYCENLYTSMPELVQHVRLEHKHVTEYDIKIVSAKDKGSPIKINVLDYGCKLCDEEVTSFEDLKRHLIDIHKKQIDLDNDGVWPYRITDNEFTCVLCGIKLEEYHRLTRHLNIHYRKFICDQCGIGFASEFRLRTHSVTHETGSYSCDECGKVFSNNLCRQQHIVNIHMEKKKIKCGLCEETFLSYYHRQKHLHSAHGVKVKEIKCNFCPKVFHRQSNVRTHIRRTHMLSAKRYTCDICNYKSLTKSLMARHMNCHSNVKNFECEVCRKKYSTKSTLREHMRIHNNDRRFVCQYCDRAFVQNVSWKGHMKRRHKEFWVESSTTGHNSPLLDMSHSQERNMT